MTGPTTPTDAPVWPTPDGYTPQSDAYSPQPVPQPDPVARRAAYQPERPVPGRPAWLLVGAILAGVVMIAAGLSWWQLALAHQVTEQSSYPGVTRVELRDLGSSDVQVLRADRADVAVSRTLHWSGRAEDRPAPREQVTDGALIVDSPCAGRAACWVDFVVQVPRDTQGVRVSVRTGSGDVRVEDADSASIQTGSGDVEACRIATALTVRTNSGDVTACPSTAGRVEVTTSSGDVTAQLVGPLSSVSITTSSGDVSLDIPADPAPAIRTDTSSGDTEVLVTSDPSSAVPVRVQTRSGDITVR